MALECSFDLGCNRIDRLPLRTAIGMINAISLIMPVQEPSPDKIRNYPADIAPARSQNTGLDLRIEPLFDVAGVSPPPCRSLQSRPNGVDHGATSAIALRQWRQCLA